MHFSHITFIINPASGKKEAILSLINEAMQASTVQWDVAVTKKDCGAGEIAAALIGKTSLIAVYGGDGCVTEVAAALQGKPLPMAIIPGGTANVMAKELGVPVETTEALKMLLDGNHELLSVDMGIMNEQPFLLRVNTGIMADMVLQADRELKESLGQLAYGITALKTVASAHATFYHLEIDGNEVNESGVSLTVTNSGHIGIGEFNLLPDISITDGFLDVILMKDAGLLSILKVAGSTLLQTETNALMHWKCKKVLIRTTEPQKLICDDHEVTATELNIRVLPASIDILIPKIKP